MNVVRLLVVLLAIVIVVLDWMARPSSASEPSHSNAQAAESTPP